MTDGHGTDGNGTNRAGAAPGWPAMIRARLDAVVEDGRWRAPREFDALGPDVEGWRVGERAGVGWFPGACGRCGHCRRGDTFACENVQGATGVSRDGGYATHMLALASALA